MAERRGGRHKFIGELLSVASSKGVGKNYGMAYLAAVRFKVIPDPISIVRHALLPLTGIMNAPADEIDAYDENVVFHEREVLFPFRLTHHFKTV